MSLMSCGRNDLRGKILLKVTWKAECQRGMLQFRPFNFLTYYWKMMIKTGATCLPDVMIIKLDTLAVPAKHAMSAKTRVELKFPSPFLEKKETKSASTLAYGKMAGLAEWAGGCHTVTIIIITTS